MSRVSDPPQEQASAAGVRGGLAAAVARASPFRVVVAVTVLGMAALVLYPLVRMLLGVFLDYSFVEAVRETLATPRVGRAMVNTGIVVFGAGGGAVVIGSVLAWLNERTDARMGWTADLLPIIPLMVPPLAVAIGWVFLLTPRAGFLNVAYRALFHPDAGPLDRSGITIYSMGGLLWVVVVVTVPLAYLTVAAALRNLDPALEEASRISGRSPWSTLRNVTLPAVRNAIATGGLLVLMRILSMFSVPIIIGTQGGIDVLATLIFRVLQVDGVPRYDQAIVLSLVMLALVQVGILLEYLVTHTGHHAKIAGKGRGRTKYPLGPWRLPARVLMLAYILAATVLPLLALAFVSLQGFWSPSVDWSSLSLDNYSELFAEGSVLGESFLNSLFLGLVAATLLLGITGMSSYFVATARRGVARFVGVVAGLPASVPSVVIGVAFLVALGVGGPRWSGTLVILLLAYLVLSLPHASRIADSALSQVGRELLEGSLMAGASHGRTFGRVLLPLMLPGLVAGWVIVFSHAFSEISASVFLSTPTSNPVAGAVIVDTFRNMGTFTELAALTVVVTLAQTVVVAAVLVGARRRLAYLDL